MDHGLQNMRIALTHDYWVRVRGGERVFLALTRMFPQANLYVLAQRRAALASFPADHRPRASFLRRIPFSGRFYRELLPLYPMAARSLDLRGYDLVISSSSGFCHAAQTDGLSVCYCHTPLRYAWQEYDATLASQRFPPARAALATVLDRVRRADYTAAQRVDAYIANSQATQARVKQFYGRESVVVHPFIDTTRFSPAAGAPPSPPAPAPGGYYMLLSALLPYKRVDLAIMACQRLGRRLIIVGEGPERARLERMAGPDIHFLPHPDDATLARLYAGCDAFLQCGREDFGIASLEAQACGRPVIAFGEGGALETVAPGVSGLYFHEQSLDAVIEALQAFDPRAWDSQAIRAHAERFDEAHFAERMRQV
ncbi:MAG: glycosyltransferase, partial [Chloroflexota bacterium]|nr:glycosyltransferase [Chloroflexota bacterium]